MASFGRPPASVHAGAHHRQAAAPIPGRALRPNVPFLIPYFLFLVSCSHSSVPPLQGSGTKRLLVLGVVPLVKRFAPLGLCVGRDGNGFPLANVYEFHRKMVHDADSINHNAYNVITDAKNTNGGA